MHHEEHHQTGRHLEADRSYTVYLRGSVNLLSNDSDEKARIPLEKPVRPTVIVENVMMGLI